MKHFYLITTYNHGAYLSETINSIVQQYADLQSFLATARVLIIDDASNDNTADLLERNLSHYGNLSYHINDINLGVGRNRNALIEWMLGEASDFDFVVFIDGDDKLTFNSIQSRINILMRDASLDAVGGQMMLIDNKGSPIGHMDTFCVDPDMAEIAQVFECQYYISNMLFRANVFKPPNVRFPDTRMSEDWLFFLTHEIRKRHIKMATLIYRRHERNLTAIKASHPDVQAIRHFAHGLGAIKMGAFLSTEDSQALDEVGFLVFKMKWNGLHAIPSDLHLPWFNDLGEAGSRWLEVRKKLVEIFSRFIACNKQMTHYNQRKLEIYLTTLLEHADKAAKFDLYPELELEAHE